MAENIEIKEPPITTPSITPSNIKEHWDIFFANKVTKLQFFYEQDGKQQFLTIEEPALSKLKNGIKFPTENNTYECKPKN